jgi:hypothetical protein
VLDEVLLVPRPVARPATTGRERTATGADGRANEDAVRQRTTS